MNLLRLIANFFSPPQCIFCNDSLDIRTIYNVCGKCAFELPYNNDKCCKICGTPLDITYGDLYCGVCKNTKRAFAQNVSRFLYRDKVADALRYMKFGKGQLWIADTFGKLLAQTVEYEYGDIEFDVVLYVPVSKKRLNERGFNQSEIIAEAVCRSLNLHKGEGILIKPFDTPKQSGLKFKDRKENVKNAFVVENSELIIDKTLLLIDDICTTGSTLNECSKTLKKAGALSVYCATVATTDLNKI